LKIARFSREKEFRKKKKDARTASTLLAIGTKKKQSEKTTSKSVNSSKDPAS